MGRKRRAPSQPAEQQQPPTVAAPAAADDGAPEKAGGGESKRQKLSNTIPYHRGAFKLRYLAKHASLLRKGDPAVGVLVSCGPSVETRTLGQSRSFLGNELSLLFPDAQTVYPPRPAPDDVDLTYAENVAPPPQDDESKPASADPQADRPQRELSKFQAVDSACSGCLFLRFRFDVAPTVFLDRVFEHIKAMDGSEAEKHLKSVSFCHRFVPIEHTCSALTLEDMRNELGPLITAELEAYQAKPTAPEKPSTAIVFERRNNVMITRDKLIQALAPSIPSTYTINLSSPDITIFISVFKSVAGMSLLPQYTLYKKYNLSQYAAA
ncbi:hypothetical protein RI367_003138 [Sorochytrium milnesiophthora]